MAWIEQFIFNIPPVRWLVNLPWSRLLGLSVGEQIALSVLTLCVLLGGLSALDRMTSDARDPEAAKPRKKKRGLGIRIIALVILALLPGGLVGSAAVLIVMGKEGWRRDAFSIVGLSLVIGVLLVWYSSTYFPFSALANNFYISGVLGITFALTQLWATIKLLREYWGEPIHKVPWYPPLALFLQTSVLAFLVYALLS
ncbi:MAG: hypothetical protein HY291_16770 [Planctomycetes bacterium]|nr:hypothetical protein [Planctomycetota bacterium]